MGGVCVGGVGVWWGGGGGVWGGGGGVGVGGGGEFQSIRMIFNRFRRDKGD